MSKVIKINCKHTKNYFEIELIKSKDMSNETIGFIREIHFEDPLPKPFFLLVANVWNFLNQNNIKYVWQLVIKKDYELSLKKHTTWTIIMEVPNSDLYLIQCELKDFRENFLKGHDPPE